MREIETSKKTYTVGWGLIDFYKRGATPAINNNKQHKITANTNKELTTNKYHYSSFFILTACKTLSNSIKQHECLYYFQRIVLLYRQ
jgi:hypothetical protein